MSKPAILVCRRVFDGVIERLGAHFEITYNHDDAHWSQDEIIARLSGKVGMFTTGGERVDARLIGAAPDLKICANMAVGYNNFDIPAMTRAGVLATNAPDVLTETTADMGFALLMATARRVSESEAFLRAGKWQRWSYDMFLGADIHGATLGILGMGRIGRAVARRGAHGFGMRVIYHNRSQLAPELEREVNAAYVSKAELFRQADHVVIVMPYTADNHHTVGRAELALMKPNATLINIGRGGLIDENALADVLEAGGILGAGLDVFEGEPQINPRLLACTNAVYTPHIASASPATRLAMAHIAADNLIGYLVHDRAVTPLNPEVLSA